MCPISNIVNMSYKQCFRERKLNIKLVYFRLAFRHLDCRNTFNIHNNLDNVDFKIFLFIILNSKDSSIQKADIAKTNLRDIIQFKAN